MSIKPVLVPDQDAKTLRALLETFDAAATGTAPKQLTEMDYGGGRSPHGGHGLPRDDDDADAGKKEVIVKPETAKKAVKGASDALNKAFDASYDEKGVAEGSENLAIGEKMARDGIEYDPAREGEIISMIGDYLRRDGMTTRQVRGYMIDPDFISDQLSYLPRKSGIAEADVPYNDPNLSKAYNLGNEAYTKLKNHPELAQAAQDRIEKEFPQYARMWLTGYRDGERFDQEKSLKESRDPVADLRRLLG